jgi:hypothetical protein
VNFVAVSQYTAVPMRLHRFCEMSRSSVWYSTVDSGPSSEYRDHEPVSAYQ